MNVLHIFKTHKFFFIWQSIVIASTAYMGSYTAMTVNIMMSLLLIGVEIRHQRAAENKTRDLTIRASEMGMLNIMLSRESRHFPPILQKLVEEKVNNPSS